MGKPVEIKMSSEALPERSYCPVCFAEEGTEHAAGCTHHLCTLVSEALEKIGKTLDDYGWGASGESSLDEAVEEVRKASAAIKAFRNADASL